MLYFLKAFYAETGCYLENLLRAVTDRDGWLRIFMLFVSHEGYDSYLAVINLTLIKPFQCLLVCVCVFVCECVCDIA